MKQWIQMAAASSALLGLPAQAALPAVQARGAAVLLPVMQQTAEHYMQHTPGATVTVVRGNNVFAMKSLLQGSADIAMVQGNIPGDIRQEIQTRQLKLRQVVIDYQRMTPVVHPDNPLHSIRLDHLQAVFAGSIDNWQMLGGRAGPIVLLVESPSQGLGQAWKEAMVGESGRLARHARMVSTEEKHALLAENINSISFMLHDQLSPAVKALRITQIGARHSASPPAHDPLRMPLSVWINAQASPTVQDVVQRLGRKPAPPQPGARP